MNARTLPLALVAALAVVLFATVGPATAIPPGGADPDTPGTSATVSPKQLTAGARISFTVTGFPAGETVYVKIDDGTACSEAAVHGACVYHQQKIPSSGTVKGSFPLPADLATGAHWLRFLASEPIVKDGQQIGVNGYTARGSSDFTVVAASGSTSKSGGKSSGTASGSGGSTSGSTGTTGTGTGAAATAGTVAGGVVAVTPGATTTATTAPSAATPTTEATDEVSAAVAEKASTTEEGSGFPWIGVLGFAGLVALSFAGTRLATSRRR